jgi:protein gp37
MAERSAIEWTDATWNPVRGCTKVSPGCKHCYAERFSERFRGVPGHPFEQGFDLRLLPEALGLPLQWKKAKRIFVNSMSDLFHESVPDSFIEDVIQAMSETPRHTYQTLTKRADRMAAFARQHCLPANVWLGVSVETCDYYGRIRALTSTDAAVRFLSLEPLLGPMENLPLANVDWVIVGGESGPGSRPMQHRWVLDIRDQCVASGVPFFFKQWGGVRRAATGRMLDGRTWDEMPREDRMLRHAATTPQGAIG